MRQSVEMLSICDQAIKVAKVFFPKNLERVSVVMVPFNVARLRYCDRDRQSKAKSIKNVKETHLFET